MSCQNSISNSVRWDEVSNLRYYSVAISRSITMAKLWVLLTACFVKKDDPELLIPPADYDVEVLESSGFAL